MPAFIIENVELLDIRISGVVERINITANLFLWIRVRYRSSISLGENSFVRSYSVIDLAPSDSTPDCLFFALTRFPVMIYLLAGWRGPIARLMTLRLTAFGISRSLMSEAIITPRARNSALRDSMS